MKKLFFLPLIIVLFCLSERPLVAQDQPTQQPSADEVEKQKVEREKNAYRLLDQVIDDAQSLRLVENRVRVQINAADMLWDQNQGRARTLLTSAAESIAELGRSQATASNNRRNQDNNFTMMGPQAQQNFRTYQLRQEVVLTAARHDAQLAYQLLAATKPPANTQPAADGRGPRAQLTSEESLEQTLLGRIAALDPKLAAQNAEQMLDKGQFPMTLGQVIDQLYKQDSDAAEKFADKAIKKIEAANILTKTEAGPLIQILLRGGPRPAPAGENTDSAAKAQTTSPPAAVLGQAAYIDLLSTVVDAALKATPATQNNPRPGPPNQRRIGIGPGAGQQNTTQQPPTDAQIEQTNARRLLAGLQVALPYIDQYLPSKATLVHQKMSELGLSNSSPVNFAQTLNSLQGEPTADALVQAAASAPQQMQSRLYQQAANKALEEGDVERARQIANDHLQNNARDSVMQRIDFRDMAKKAEGARIDDIRQIVARLQNDGDKIDLLIQLATDVQTSGNQKLATQLLEDAKQIVNHRATGYEHFEQQLKVARAFGVVDPSRSFELLEPGITQLNELLSAAAMLSGFEINMFRDGEMAIQGGNGLTATINRYGQELAVLAGKDFERSETLAARFQFPEPRIMTRMAIVQGLLGVTPVSGPRAVLGNFGNSIVIRP